MSANVTRNMIDAAVNSNMHVIGSQLQRERNAELESDCLEQASNKILIFFCFTQSFCFTVKITLQGKHKEVSDNLNAIA